MKRQDQQLVEMLESQISQSSEKSQDKNCATQQSYRSPQVHLVGKAQRLIASSTYGSMSDAQGTYTYQ